jgi:hypothetical protein
MKSRGFAAGKSHADSINLNDFVKVHPSGELWGFRVAVKGRLIFWSPPQMPRFIRSSRFKAFHELMAVKIFEEIPSCGKPL